MRAGDGILGTSDLPTIIVGLSVTTMINSLVDRLGSLPCGVIQESGDY